MEKVTNIMFRLSNIRTGHIFIEVNICLILYLLSIVLTQWKRKDMIKFKFKVKKIDNKGKPFTIEDVTLKYNTS